jgi:serine/threonine-protein kinase
LGASSPRRWELQIVSLSSGQTFAGFSVVRLLGRGGMGEVYLVRHPRLPRQEALKLLSADLAADADYRDRFHREADLAANLWHPHLVGLHDRGESEGRLWISMDYIDGPDAATLMATRYPAGVPGHDVMAIVTAVASALDYAHHQGMVHRDVKPANILCGNFGSGEPRIALADFGVAREQQQISGLDATNLTVSAVAYAAPEQLMGLELDGRADQYALAATAFHLITAEPLFGQSNPVAVISQHLNVNPPLLSSRRPELAGMDGAFQRALAKSPEHRFDSCADFARALNDQLNPRAAATNPTQPSVGSAAAPSTTAVAAPTTTGTAAPLTTAVAAPPTTGAGEAPGADHHQPRRRWMFAAAAAVAVVVLAVAALLAGITLRAHHRPITAATQSPPLAAPPPQAPPFDGAYQLNWAPKQMVWGTIPLSLKSAPATWWAFRSECRPDGCIATAIRLDDDTHQTAFVNLTDRVLRFVDNAWRELTPDVDRESCGQGNTQSWSYQWSFTPQPDGTLSGNVHKVVTSNECSLQGLTMTIAMTSATRIGDVPPGVAVPNTELTALPPLSAPGQPDLGQQCADTDKVDFNTTTNAYIVCTGATWSVAPNIVGIRDTGQICDLMSDALMSVTADGYLVQCVKDAQTATTTWQRARL